MTEQTPSAQPPVPAPHESEKAPAAAAPQTRREQVSAYAQGSVANMLRSLLVIGAIMAVLVLIFPRAQPEVRPVDVTATAQQVEQSTGWPITAPRDLPEGWVPTRAQYLRSTDGLMSWQAAYQTPAGDFAALHQTIDATDTWVAAQVNRSPRVGQAEVDGAAWERYDREGKVQRSLVRRGGSGEVTTVVTGTASFEELELLVRSLAPVDSAS